MKVGDRYRFVGGLVIEIDDILKDPRGRGKSADLIYYRASDGSYVWVYRYELEVHGEKIEKDTK